MKKLITAASVALGIVAASAAMAGETPAPTGASVYFINIKDGDVLTNPVTIQFGLKGMGVAPAGTEKKNTGHHHLIIDGTVAGEALDAPIDSDETHRHFGGGQTQTTMDLPKGSHTLQLVLGDWSHIPHSKPVMSDRITVTVK
ncbi:MAG: DUF4399 domain-containing protein [Alphaproteobacteria bacterium]|jgi:hypothetical protein